MAQRAVFVLQIARADHVEHRARASNLGRGLFLQGLPLRECPQRKFGERALVPPELLDLRARQHLRGSELRRHRGLWHGTSSAS